MLGAKSRKRRTEDDAPTYHIDQPRYTTTIDAQTARLRAESLLKMLACCPMQVGVDMNRHLHLHQNHLQMHNVLIKPLPANTIVDRRNDSFNAVIDTSSCSLHLVLLPTCELGPLSQHEADTAGQTCGMRDELDARSKGMAFDHTGLC